MLINDASITGSLIVNASSSFQNIAVSGNILPGTNNVYNLGSIDKYFKEIFVSTGSIKFVDNTGVKTTITSVAGGGIQIGSVQITTSSIAFVDSTGSVTQTIAQSSSLGSTSNFTTTASFNSYTSSNDTTNTTQTGRLSNLETKSASVDIHISATNTFTSSTTTRLTNIETKSASVDISITNINTFTSSNANTSLNSYTASNDTKWTTLTNVTSSLIALTGSLATTGSNTFRGTTIISGSTYVTGDLVVFGSSSIQYISASSVSIGTNIVNLNTANPVVRYGGLSVIDSGSATGKSGSFLFDSRDNEWIFVHQGGVAVTSSTMITGPETYNALGEETHLTDNIIPKSLNGFHIVDSCLFDNGTTTCFYNSTTINSSGVLTSTNLVGTICARNGVISGSAQVDGTAITNKSITIAGTSTALGGTITLATMTGGSAIHSGSYLATATTANLSENTNLYYTDARVKTKLSAETVISGSGQVAIASTSGFGTYINQALLTTSSPTFAGLTINTGGTGTWGPVVIQSTSCWGDGATQYATIGAGAAGIMIYNPHIVWNGGNTAAAFRMGRSGGISSGAYYEVGVGASDNFFIAKNALATGTQLNINSSGNATFSGTLSASNLSGTNTGDQTNISGNAATVTNGVYTNASNTLTNNLNITGGQGAGNTAAYSSAKRLIFDNDYTTTAKGPNKITLYDAGFLAGFGIHNSTVSYYSGDTHKWYKATTSADASIMMQLDGSGNFNATGDITAYSDVRVKENILNILDPLNKVLKLRGVSYNRIDTDDKTTKIGFIAQEIQKIIPEVVSYDESEDRYSVSYGNMTALLVEAIKEQQIKIDNLTLEIENLKKPKGL